MNSKVDAFLSKARKWQQEMTMLRDIAMGCNLHEDFKWMHPCYTLDGSNIVLIHGFKDYCALLFFKGVLMDDPKKLLIQQTENVQDRRQLRFTSAADIARLTPVIRSYIEEAIRIEQSGEKVTYKPTTAFTMPEEFKLILDSSPDIKTAFEALTPGRQRGYLLYFAAAKQSKTRLSRIEKCLPGIRNGKGLED